MAVVNNGDPGEAQTEVSTFSANHVRLSVKCRLEMSHKTVQASETVFMMGAAEGSLIGSAIVGFEKWMLITTTN